ncbi:DNA-binding protein [Nocardia sp. NPDC050413]|uniref:DNA-binding protein n=1 Tax=Nocardia sp. NPDC050413 TaxID=3155784 RepID=UPI00340B4E18
MNTGENSTGPVLIGLRDAGVLAGGVHPTTVRRWVKAGLLQAFQVGPRLIKVDRAEVLALKRPLVEGGAK